MIVRKKPGAGHSMARAMAAELASELADEIGVEAFERHVKHLPAVPSVHEVNRLLNAARDEPRDYLIIRLLYYTGMRVGELAALCLADVQFDDGLLFIRGGKGDRDRYVCVDPETLRLIKEGHGKRELSERIVGLRPSAIERIVRKHGRHIGLVQKYEAMERSFSPHSLRHAWATHRHDAGMDLDTLRKLLGHQFLSTTMIYVETSMRHAQKQYRKTDPLHGK